MRGRLFVLSLLIVTLLPSLSSAELKAEDVKAIRAASDAWVKAASAAEWGKLAALYTEDGVLLPPNAPAITGRKGIEGYMAGFPPVSDIVFEIVEVDGGRDFAYVWGTYSMTITPKGADPIKDKGKFIEIRKKQEDGTWLILRDIYNSDMAEKK